MIIKSSSFFRKQQKCNKTSNSALQVGIGMKVFRENEKNEKGIKKR